MSDISQLQQALRDVREVRRAIERTESRAQPIGMAGLQASRAIHVIVLLGVLVLAGFDLFMSPSLSFWLWATADSRLQVLRFAAVFLILATLIALGLLVYFIVWRNARRANEELSAFIGRNFRYLSLASLTSDLFVKFSAVALVILAQRPDWVAPVLVACTGDWLIQGRGFVLPVKVGLPLGFSFILLSIITLIYFEGYLYQALLPFAIPTVLSFTHVQRLINLESDG